MKNQLFTRNTFLSILMTLVLALSVQGIADALSFRENRSGDLKTIVQNKEFTVSLTVDPGSDTTRIMHADGYLVSDDGTTRIDSSGYKVFKASDDREYRLSTAANALSSTFVGSRPAYSDETPQADATSGTLYVDSSGRVVNDAGVAVYIRTGTGTRYDNNNTPNDPNDDTAADPYKYTRATANPDTKVSDADRYHYNEESISISVPTGTTLTKVGNYPVNKTAAHPMNEAASSTNEDKLIRSLSLTYRADAVGEKIITITDTTDPSDRPGAAATPLSFTIFVVPDRDDSTTLSLNSTNVPNGYLTRNDYADPRVDNLFSETGTNTTDAPIIYSVAGSGRLYVEKTYGDGSPTSKSSLTPTLSTSNAAKVYLDMNGSSNKVTAYVRDQNAVKTSKTIHFIFQYAQIEITNGNNQTGVPDSRLIEPLRIRVKDAKGRALSGLAVTFDPNDGAILQPVIGTDVYLETNNTWADQFSDIAKTKTATATVPAAIAADAAALVPTDRSGEAEVYLKLGAAGNKTVTVSVGGDSDTFYVTSSTSTDIPSLEIFSGNNQKSASDGKVADPLVVRVLASNNQPLPTQVVTFTTTKGYLRTPTAYQNADKNGPAAQVTAVTDVNGKAAVTYDLVNHSGASDVIAEISSITVPTYQRRVTFNINGTTTTTQPAQPTQPTTPTLTIETSGEGATREVTVIASNGQAIGVTLGGTALTASQVVTAGTSTRITLPTNAGTYTLTATAPGYTAALPTTVTVAAAASSGTLSLALVSAQVNGQQTIQVTARTSAGALVTTPVTVTLSGAGVSKTVSTTATGSVNTIIALPTTAGTLTASATGYTSGTLALPARTTTTTDTTPTTTPTTPTTTPTVSDPASISISGPGTRSGVVNEEIEAALLVQVLDADGEGVEDARVTFRVRTGQGRLSQRGNGRAIAVRTNAEGYARADYTPMSARSTVEGSVTGVTRTVTFTITATGSVPATPTPSGTTRTTAIDPKILVGAGNRPAMVWVDNGMLYGLTGGEATKIAESVNGAALGNGKVYWTAATGASSGTVNSANLDGSGAKVLTTIMAIPMGISVDTANSKLYWTNSRGRVQSASLNGSSIRNVQQNLSSPGDIALGNGHIYWTEDGSSIRRVNMTGTKVVKDVAVGLMDVGGIAIGGGKIYWTEKTGGSAGTINGANPDGTQFKTLATIKAVPMGIAVDTAGKKLYWTNSRGRVQSGTLSAGKITNVVDGLGTPSHLAIGSASQGTTAAKPTQPAKQPPKKDTTAYDVNGDGTVDNTDASLVSEAMGTDNKKYDVNGDGTVNFFDLMLVFDNRDAEAAAAPTIVGMQLSSVQIAVIEEQIDLLIATGDRSPTAMRTLVYLQQLLATARPEKTQLLANYPNPFNPETWIPYELAMDTDVRITIYNAQGVVIRTLQLGQQSAGYYTDRERAAYWDGRNALGEQVASGIYFYQLETDDMSSLRKMVILK